jgi:hypothetical protein
VCGAPGPRTPPALDPPPPIRRRPGRAYHLLISIETSFLRKKIHTSWATLRDQLSTHQVITAVLPTPCGQLLQIRKGTNPEKQHQAIYDTLGIPHEVMAPLKTWLPNPE